MQYIIMVKKEDLHWTKKDDMAIEQYKKQFEAGKIDHTILSKNFRDLLE